MINERDGCHFKKKQGQKSWDPIRVALFKFSLHQSDEILSCQA